MVVKARGGLKENLNGMVRIRSRIFRAQKSNHLLQVLPNYRLELNKRLPKHTIQSLFAKVNATLVDVQLGRP